jgi:HK97 gp10 family phage protein
MRSGGRHIKTTVSLTVKDFTREIINKHHAGFAKVVAQTAFALEGWAKVYAPIDTGFLRNSIASNETGAQFVSSLSGRMGLGTSSLTWYVTVGAEYGIHQEFGTMYQSGTPFMRPAASRVSTSFTNGLLKVMNQEAK